jgi:serine/threonine protein kinase
MIETVPSGTILNGRYRVERALGSGGFGHVYLAVELATHQQYAIKEYLVTGPTGQEQLRHEANVLSQLHHPNIPAFHDAFSERGRYYVVLNYIEGNDLTDIIRSTNRRNEAVPLTRIMGWILAVCDAVHFLHSQRPPVIHRDIKPDNIRITSNGVAILVDLGNAKATADGARTLFFIRHQGTPGYAPPEQYPGGSGTDARSDVYALGGTLFFALTTHEPPSVSARNQAIQQGQVDLPTLRDQLAKNPPQTSPQADPARQFRLGVTKPGKPAPRHSYHLAQLGTLPPELLNQLDRVIQKAMAMKPKDRYQSVAELANDLRKVMAALSTPSAHPLDPHSTQPDLPMLYEALLAAQGNADTATPDIDTAPVPGPSSPPSSPITNFCPRCNTPLASQASFCPRCGTPLGGPSNRNLPNVSATGNTSQATKSRPSGPSVQSLQQPATHRPQSISYVSPGSSSQRPAPASSFSARNMAQAVMQPPPSFSRNGAVSGNTSLGTPIGKRSSSSSGFKVGPVPLVVMAVILVLLVIIMIVLLNILSHRGGHADLYNSLHWYVLSTQVAYSL